MRYQTPSLLGQVNHSDELASLKKEASYSCRCDPSRPLETPPRRGGGSVCGYQKLSRSQDDLRKRVYRIICIRCRGEASGRTLTDSSHSFWPDASPLRLVLLLRRIRMHLSPGVFYVVAVVLLLLQVVRPNGHLALPTGNIQNIRRLTQPRDPPP